MKNNNNLDKLEKTDITGKKAQKMKHRLEYFNRK